MKHQLGWYIEVSDGVFRKTPPEIIRVSDLPRWQGEHQGSELGLFRSIYEYPTEDPYVGGVMSDFYVVEEGYVFHVRQCQANQENYAERHCPLLLTHNLVSIP